MNAFHVCGALFAVWAVVVSFVGITREDFPNTRGMARAVGVISILLAVATVSSAIITSATEEHEPEEEHALVR